MTATLRMRSYQRETVDAVFTAWAGGMERPAVVLPTGAGKTVVFSEIIRQWRTAPESIGEAGLARISTGRRAIVLVHRDELADQAIGKIRAAAPELSVGKVKAEDDEITADVMVCSVQTLSRARRLRRLVEWQTAHGKVGLILTDECHHAVARSYQTVYNAFPDALHAGFTATLARGDGAGLGSVWQDVVYSRSALWMMREGYLVQPRGWTAQAAGLDLDSVKRTGGDYGAADLGRALEEADVPAHLPDVWHRRAEGRPTLVFTPTVATARAAADAFRSAGVTSAVISGQTPREERRQIFEDFRLGRTTVLCNCMVLTEGTDLPWASCAIIARPTRSAPLYIQMVGRVLRPWEGKKDAVVIHVAGAGGKISTLVDLEPGAVDEVREGEGLTEAEDREELEAADEASRTEIRCRQVLKLSEVSSMFEASHQAWLTTAGGVRFLSAGEWTYFLWPSSEPGTWDVCRKPKYGKWERTQHTGLGVDMAMSWAEAEAEGHGSFSVARSASWRGKSRPPSQAQTDFAQTLGIVTKDLNKGQLSDAISYVLESRALDPFIGVV